MVDGGKLWVVVWTIPFEDGGLSSVWTTQELAAAEALRLNTEDRIGREFTVSPVVLDTSGFESAWG